MISVRTEQLEGRPHWVVPTVLITEGTWSGSGGPIHYPGEALKASVQAWNGKPVVVYHPDMHGHSFAAHPFVFNKQKVGVLFGAAFRDGKLRAEAWLDQERLRAVDIRIATAVNKRRPMEVSTGVMVLWDNQHTANGAPIAAALQPDHLAILPTGRGACSIEDGAGLLVNRHVETTLPLPEMAF